MEIFLVSQPIMLHGVSITANSQAMFQDGCIADQILITILKTALLTSNQAIVAVVII